jgi:hypothetical protein
MIKAVQTCNKTKFNNWTEIILKECLLCVDIQNHMFLPISQNQMVKMHENLPDTDEVEISNLLAIMFLITMMWQS